MGKKKNRRSTHHVPSTADATVPRDSDFPQHSTTLEFEDAASLRK